MLKKTSILIVEDEVIIANDIEYSLKEFGYNVVGFAATGRQAIEKAGQYKPDLILMDIILQGEMDGIEAAEEIKKQFNIPVIFLTGNADSATIERAKLTTPFGYILKPFEDRELHIIIEMGLYKHKTDCQQDILLKTIKESLEYVDDIVQSITDPMIILSPSSTIRKVNKPLCDILGYKEEELLEMPLNKILIKNYSEHQLTEKAGDEESIFGKNVEMNFLSKNGNEIPIMYSTSVMTDSEGNIKGSVCIAKDVTEQRMRQQQLQKAYALINKDLKTALTLQESLLPEPMTIYNIEFEWLYKPSLYLSGDTFNYFKLDENHIGIYLIDVVGHGISSALLSFSLNKLLSPLVDEGNPLKYRSDDEPFYRISPPSLAIEAINNKYQKAKDSLQYFSMVYAVIECNTGITRIVTAGHPQPFLLKKNGEILPVGKHCSPVGIIKNIKYEEVEFTLNVGDRLFIYSDGITECSNPRGEFFSDTRFSAHIKEHAGLSLKDYMNDFQDTLNQWRGDSEFDDDISMVAIEIK